MIEVIGLGAGGHAKVVIEILKLNNEYTIVGLLHERVDKAGIEIAGIPILGHDSTLSELHARGIHHAFIGVGTVGQGNRRPQLYEMLRTQGFTLVAAIHPKAVISPSAQIGAGPTIMAGVVINAGVHIGDNVIINTGAIVDHDCVIGDHSHIATGACLSGAVKVSTGAHIGVGAVVRQEISIGRNSVVGAGAVVIDDVPDNVVVIGVPAKTNKGTSV